ncbi:MAG: GTP cyclohydrolase I FolE2 [Desulfobulbaceae bacterium]|nr:GTP cyclohydrolase I FolE2 [Desulfobulbaceae bacterium]
MKDIQSLRDHRRINIKKVGVKDISYPITVLDRAKKVQKTVAKVNMYVNLPHQFKGTHMSRFIEILNHFHGDINLRSFQLILEETKSKLQAEAAHMEIEFPYFFKKKSSTDAKTELVEYHCKMHGSLEGSDDLTLEIAVPISPPVPVQSHSGLPESLGHWGVANICLRFKHFIWMEQLIEMVEDVTSHDLKWSLSSVKPAEYSLSVEKIAKDLGQKLSSHANISWCSVTVENFCQGFSTFATIEWPENSQTQTHITNKKSTAELDKILGG